MATTTERAIFVDLCTHPATLSAAATGPTTGVVLEQAHGDTIIYRIYFRRGDELIDPPVGFTYSLIAKRSGDWNGDAIISLNTDGQITKLTDDDGDKYLKVPLAPTAPLIALFAATKSCPNQVPAKIRLDAEIAWSNGTDIRRTRIFPLCYTHGVVAADEVFAELDPPSVGLSQVTLADGNELATGSGTAGDPLYLRYEAERIELAVSEGATTFDMSGGDYGALGYTPAEYEPVALVPPGVLADDYAVSIAGVKGDSVRFSAAIPAAGWKLRVRA